MIKNIVTEPTRVAKKSEPIRSDERNGLEKFVGIQEGSGLTICEAAGCFAQATTTVEVNAGHHRKIPLSLCKTCVDMFVGEE